MLNCVQSKPCPRECSRCRKPLAGQPDPAGPEVDFQERNE
jgi:hypothetical protein